MSVLIGFESVYSCELLESLAELGRVVEYGLVLGEPEWDMEGAAQIGPRDVTASIATLECVLPWVTPGYKWQKLAAARALGFASFPPVVDRMAHRARTCVLAEGVYLNAGAAAGAYAELGAFSSLNRSASVGHHTKLAPFVSIGPGATIAARCFIGRGTMVGAGAVVTPGVSVGDNCLVAAGSVVTKDFPSNCLIAGNPAKLVRSDYGGYKDVAVPA